MIKDLIKYALLAIALLVVTMLVTYAFAHVFHLDKTNRNAVDDWLYLLLLIPVFHKLRYIDLQDAISVNRFSWGVFLVAFICLSTMSYAIDMGASLLHISKDSQSQMEMEVVRHPFALFTVSVIAPISEEFFFAEPFSVACYNRKNGHHGWLSLALHWCFRHYITIPS